MKSFSDEPQPGSADRTDLAAVVAALREEADRYVHVLDLLSREDPTAPSVTRNVMLVSAAHGVTLNSLIEDLEAAARGVAAERGPQVSRAGR